MRIHPDHIREEQLDALKASSMNYKRWQQALMLRDDIIKANGVGTVEYAEARTLIQFWCDKWQKEMETHVFTLDNHSITVRVRAMKEEMEREQKKGEKE